MSQHILTWGFYLLFFLTPLIFTPFNHELFEYNKMMVVYALTAVITVCWLIKMVNRKSFIVNQTPLDIPIILFLISQILSTIFSIDPHTSFWGYYSRSNGGLLSIISYILLYYALVSNFKPPDVLKLLKAVLLGGLVVALYAIPEHFGASPSCTLLNLDQGIQIRADCWVQDVQARVFATLGQPNWLAAYLAMLIFPCLYFIITAKSRFTTLRYMLFAICYYLAFTFTFSRGAMIGFLVGFLVFVSLFLVLCFRFSDLSHAVSLLIGRLNNRKRQPNNRQPKTPNLKLLKPLLLVSCLLVIINLLFGSSLTGNNKLLKDYAPPRPTFGQSGGGTQLESGGTESGQIRLIVWQGAINIFKHYPYFGSGVETFAYSYYNFRPVAHNLTSEWDFLYNKAHNEYLNYLATTGAVGFVTYLLLILSFIGWSILRIYNPSTNSGQVFKFPISNFQFRLQPLKEKLSYEQQLFLIAILASYVSYLVQNFFGFSVVIIAVFFFIFPALAITSVENLKPAQLPAFLHKTFSWALKKTILRNNIFQKTTNILLVLSLIFILGVLANNWAADFLYKLGSDNSDGGDINQAYIDLADAVNSNPNEPLYRSELGFTLANLASMLKTDDATASSELADEAVRQTEIALTQSPKNVSFWRTSVRTYYQMSLVDPKFIDKALDSLDQSIKLAPTDPKLYYNKGLVLSQNSKIQAGVDALKYAIELKPNYTEAHFTLSLLYEQLKQNDLAIKEMEAVLKLDPGNPDAVKKIEELEE